MVGTLPSRPPACLQNTSSTYQCKPWTRRMHTVERQLLIFTRCECGISYSWSTRHDFSSPFRTLLAFHDSSNCKPTAFFFGVMTITTSFMGHDQSEYFMGHDRPVECCSYTTSLSMIQSFFHTPPSSNNQSFAPVVPRRFAFYLFVRATVNCIKPLNALSQLAGVHRR